jgi:hypothetical protein
MTKAEALTELSEDYAFRNPDLTREIQRLRPGLLRARALMILEMEEIEKERAKLVAQVLAEQEGTDGDAI